MADRPTGEEPGEDDDDNRFEGAFQRIARRTKCAA
jgi:hypothetical protein